MKPFDPIRYSRRQVALMVKICDHLSPDFAKQVNQAGDQILKISEGRVPPSAAVLRYFDLKSDGRGYVWQPR
jgi:hypothetical protein